MKACDNCGARDASLMWEGYVTPLPDVAPTHHEWQELWLCRDCQNEPEVLKHYHLDEKGGASDG